MSNNINKTGLIGNPIEHSLSPEIHNYWIKQNQLKTEEYQKIKLDIDNLESQVSELIKNKFFGLNVTIPFKEELYLFCDDVSGTAKKLKAINTITCNNGKIFGTNTDPDGFINSLSNQIKNENITNKNALVIGAGGVSPSVIFSLSKSKVQNISITNRTHDRSIFLKKKFSFLNILDWKLLEKKLYNFDIIVNATSLGLKNGEDFKFIFENVKKNLIYIDTIYNPIETKTLKFLKENKIKTFNGLDMFIYQGQKSFYLWNKINPEIDEELVNLLLSKIQ